MLINGKVKCDACGEFAVRLKSGAQLNGFEFAVPKAVAEEVGVETRYDVCTQCFFKAFGVKVEPKAAN